MNPQGLRGIGPPSAATARQAWPGGQAARSVLACTETSARAASFTCRSDAELLSSGSNTATPPSAGTFPYQKK